MKILIAEDDPDIAQSLKKNFLDESYSVDLAEDGKVTLEMLAFQNYDLLLLDWSMPLVSGIEVCYQLRASGNNIPIILITALSATEKKVEALNSGADDYITKPFSFEEVFARVKAVMRRQNTQVYLSFGKMQLHLPDRRLFVNGAEIKLTEKEFELLRYFISNRNRIINKEELCRQVWGYDFVPDTNIVESSVKNLRKKLEPFCEKKLLRNIYGEGYILIEA